MRVMLSNLGCKLNQAELENLARHLGAAGHRVVGSLSDADVHIVNTCTVTHIAARDSRKLARRASRSETGVKTVLTGCYVTAEPEEAARLAGVDLVVPNSDKDQLLDRLYERFPEMIPVPVEVDRVEIPYVPIEFGNSRALVKIEDGCNMSCSFCIIPATRGRQVSRPADEILAEVDNLSFQGYPEIVITGVQISSYRWYQMRLFDLTRSLLEKSSASRLRLTSIAPWQFDDRLLDLFASQRLCRHIHLSLQSGCNATLERMRRPYTSTDYAALIGRLRSAVPGLAITTDVIVGFPGETDEEFECSLEFTRQMKFARIHAFPYSQRSGTRATDLPNQINHQIKRARMLRMLEVAQSSRREFELRQTGTMAEVLWECRKQDAWLGTTDNYLRVKTESTSDLSKQITRVELQAAPDIGMSCAL